MGSVPFTTYSAGATAQNAFRLAKQEAEEEYGHGPYTGTIVEVDAFTVLVKTPMSRTDAEALAAKLIREDDPRIADKTEACGAIPTLPEDGTPGWVFVGWAAH